MNNTVAMDSSGWVDIHCHLLPGLDDGPKTLEDALAMARMAVADGVGVVVATPHINPGTYDNTLPGIRQAVEAFRPQLAAAGIPLQLAMAAEVRLTPGLLGRLLRREIPTYDPQGKVFLLEFPPQGIDEGSLYQVELIRLAGFRPIIAHPERNRAVRRRAAVLTPFVELGCWLQLTAESLTGVNGLGIQGCAQELVERGWVRFIASDGHGFYHRHPVMSDGVRVLGEWIGVHAAETLASTNPHKLLRGELH